MAKKKKMTDDEIEQYIKSKSMSSEEYVAPKATVKKANVTKSNNVSKVNSNTSNLVSQPTVTSTQTVTMPTVNTVDSARKNYNEKLSLFNKASEELDKKRVEELNKRNIDLTKKFEKQDYKDNVTNGVVTNKKSIQQREKEYEKFEPELQTLTEPERQAQRTARNDLKLARYQKNLAEVEDEGVSELDKFVSPFITGMGDVVSTITDDNKYRNENGEIIYLPSKNDLKYQQVRESYGDGFLNNIRRFGGDVTHELGKQAVVQAVNAGTGGKGGQALYFTDIIADQYKQNVNEGYDENASLSNALVKGGSNYIKQKIIGGLGGKLTGGDASWLENKLTNTYANAISNPRVLSMVSSMSAEALDEFTDTYVEAGIDAAMLGKDFNADELFVDALYSGAVGGATGAASGVVSIDPEVYQAIQNKQNTSTKPNVSTKPNIETKPQNTNTLENQSTQTETPQIETKPQGNINTQTTTQNVENNLKTTTNEAIANEPLVKVRTAQDISNKNVNAFQYDNPNVRPFFRDAALDLNEALNTYTTRGERTMLPDGTWTGTKFSSTPEITELKNDYNMSYKDIQKGIDGIIDDNGKENNAASKKVELVIDKMLRNGYRSEFDELTNKPNQDYINTLEGKEIEENLPFSTEEEDRQFEEQQKKWKEQLQNQANENIAERKSEDVIKVASNKMTNDLNEATKGNKQGSQDFKSMRKEIEQETGKPMRSWVETSTKATGTTELVNSMDKSKITYEPTSNKKNLDAAKRELAGKTYKQKLEIAKAIIDGDKRIKSTDVAVLELVIQEAQQQGKVNDFIDLVQDTAILGTETGQVVQALSLIRQSDPVTQIDTLRKLIEREQSKGNKIYQGVEINQDLVEDVLNSYNDDGSFNQEQFDDAMDELKQDIISQMKVRPTEKLNAWRYLSMLGNPKTHIRNIVANIAMRMLQGTKNKIAAGIEAATPMNKLNQILGGDAEATRGKTLKSSTQEVKNFSDSKVEQYFQENKQSNKYTENVNTLKNELERGRKIFSDDNLAGKAVNYFSKLNNDLLDKEDVTFNKAVTKRAFANFLTANGIETQADIDANPELVAQAMDYATFKGNEATFHQYSTTGTVLRNARESLRNGSNLSRVVGLGMDSVLPFINTPINIAKTGIEYTPGLGLLKTASDVKSAPKDLKADVFVDSISKQFAGGMLAAVGYALASQGILNGKSSEEKDEKLEKNLGKQDYSVNIGDNTYDLSWLSPSAMPLFVGVELYDTLKDNKKISPEMVMDILASTIDPLSEMSVISSVTEALQSYSKGTQALQDIGRSAFTSYLSQYFPTVLGQLATVFDDKQRSSSGKTTTEKLINQVKYKIPGLRNTLPEQVNVWGEDKKLSDNPIIRAAEAFVSPANRKELKVDDTTKEVERIYENTGSGLPSLSVTQSPKIDSDYVNLNSEEYTKYKKDYGKTSKELLDELVQTKDYKDATDDEREKMISAIYKYSTYVARKNIADDKNIKYEYKQSDGTGYNYPKYYLSLSKDDFAKYIAEKYNKEDE